MDEQVHITWALEVHDTVTSEHNAYLGMKPLLGARPWNKCV